MPREIFLNLTKYFEQTDKHPALGVEKAGSAARTRGGGDCVEMERITGGAATARELLENGELPLLNISNVGGAGRVGGRVRIATTFQQTISTNPSRPAFNVASIAHFSYIYVAIHPHNYKRSIQEICPSGWLSSPLPHPHDNVKVV